MRNLPDCTLKHLGKRFEKVSLTRKERVVIKSLANRKVTAMDLPLGTTNIKSLRLQGGV